MINNYEYQDGDIVIKDDRHYGNVAFCEGKLIARAKEYDELEEQIAKWMKAHSYYPNIFIQSDHGNLHLTEIDINNY